MSELFVGVDAGGTSSFSISATRNGLVQGSAKGGPANLQEEGVGSCSRAIVETVRKLSNPKSIIHCIGAGVPGARMESDQELLAEMISDSLGCEIVVRGDAEVACIASFPDGEGIVIVAGTGSSAMAVANRSIVARAGGWGPLLGDGGSAYWIGLEALRAVVRAADGCGERTMLSDYIRRAFGLPSLDELVHVVKEQGRDRIAQLSRIVYDVAKSGDAVAGDILRRAGYELGAIAGSVAKKLDAGARVALVGGVFKAGDYVVVPLLDVLKRMGIDAKVVRPRFPPCVGGLILAYERFGIVTEDSILGNLEGSISCLAGIYDKGPI